MRQNRQLVIKFLNAKLNLAINSKNDIIVKAKSGIKFLGVEIYPKGMKLNSRNRLRIQNKMNTSNISGYYGLVKNFENQKKRKLFIYQVLKYESKTEQFCIY